MIQEVEKTTKVALCRRCYGTGFVSAPLHGTSGICPQCEGSGRVTVSAKMTFDIRPYKTKNKK